MTIWQSCAWQTWFLQRWLHLLLSLPNQETERGTFHQFTETFSILTISDTFTLLAAIIGLIATDIQDFGGHLMHAILTLISIVLCTTQTFSSFDGNSMTQVYEYVADMFDNEASGLLYTLVSSIFWSFLALYQAIFNCKHEHANQQRRKRLHYQSINKHHSFSMRPIELNAQKRKKTKKKRSKKSKKAPAPPMAPPLAPPTSNQTKRPRGVLTEAIHSSRHKQNWK